MSLGPPLTPELAAKALASWWEMAGLEPFDMDAAIRAGKRASAQSSPANPPSAASPPARPIARAQASAARKPVDALADAQRLAQACTSIEALQKAIAGFDGCTLKSHARNAVFNDGISGAPIMIIGEAPDRDEDEAGKSFVGQNGLLLDKMLSSIGLSRTSNCYLTNLIPWRPPGDRKPTAEELAICKPFMDRHLELADPKAVLFIGGLSAQTILGVNDSVMKLRARSFSLGRSGGIYAQCTLSPAYLLNRPSEKSLAWKDLLRFQEEISARGVALSK